MTTSTEPGSDPTRTENQTPESMMPRPASMATTHLAMQAESIPCPLSMTDHGQTGPSNPARTHEPDRASGRRALTGQPFKVASYNVRTLADTTNDSGRDICFKLEQIIADCEEHNIDILVIQEHRRSRSNTTHMVSGP